MLKCISLSEKFKLDMKAQAEETQRMWIILHSYVSEKLFFFLDEFKAWQNSYFEWVFKKRRVSSDVIN